LKYVTEPSKQVPIGHEADVVVAGGGISGMFAALASARLGARTLLVDRFGSLGGNMGPGMFIGGAVWTNDRIEGGFTGIPKEFVERVRAQPGLDHPTYPDYSNRVSYVAFKMMEEAGVDLMLSAYAGHPIVEDGTVKGLFVENKSGRQAITAKLVIDATGDADIAGRAGVKLIRPDDPVSDEVLKTIDDAKARYASQIGDDVAPLVEQLTARSSGMGLWFMIDGADWDKWKQYQQGNPEPSKEDLKWYNQEVSPDPPMNQWLPIFSFIRRAWQAGDYTPRIQVNDLGHIFFSKWGKVELLDHAMFGARTGTSGMFDSGNAQHVSLLEAKTRTFIYETARFFRKYVPGFEKSYLFLISPFLGARGGPFIEGEYTLTAPDLLCEHRRFDDVLYVYTLASDSGIPMGCTCDVPYRIMIPKGLEGLLATGRSASYGRALRSRISCMHMGQAVGTAAALIARNNTTVRGIDVKVIQRELLKAGFFLGNQERLKELGLT